MLTQVSQARRSVTLAAGICGVVAAHLVAYALTYWDHGRRAQVLHDTGHGYFAVALWAASAAAATAVAAVVAVAVGGAARRMRPTSPGSTVPGFAPLAVWQGLLFVAVETLERCGAGSPLGEMVHGHEVLIGLAVQVVVAAGIVLLLGGAERLSSIIAGSFRPPAVPADGAVHLRSHASRPCLRLAAGSLLARAPPGPVVSPVLLARR